MCGYDGSLPVRLRLEIRIDLPAYSLNQIKTNPRSHQSNPLYRRMRDAYTKALRQAGIPKAERRRRIVFTRVYAGACRKFDHDNLVGGLKPLRDALRMVGAITNDTEACLEQHHKQIPGDSNRIELLIEEPEYP